MRVQTLIISVALANDGRRDVADNVGIDDVEFRGVPLRLQSSVKMMVDRINYTFDFHKLNLETCASFHRLIYHDINMFLLFNNLIRRFLYGIEYSETLKKITKHNIVTNGCFVSSSEMTHLQSLHDSDKYHELKYTQIEKPNLVFKGNEGICIFKRNILSNKIYYNFLFEIFSLPQNIQSDIFTVSTIAPTGRRVVELFTELGNKVRTALDVRVCSDRLIIFVIGVWKPSQLHTNYEKRIKPLPLWDGIKFKHCKNVSRCLFVIKEERTIFNSFIQSCTNETINQLQMRVLFALPVLRNCYTLRRSRSQSSRAYKFVAADIIAANELTSKLVD
ncbi:hypothetical protein ALC56_11735 [Trachymyrmex septentrionalis]|uniref:Uncharacterized protein n=1 Tax=Trachymyrmex septentrionalis TaxID=34720 RepID=A0A195F0N3_9HYME|nr:hypothetical protein ALC56_11735 [Trachymyrmex septentrionalis]